MKNIAAKILENQQNSTVLYFVGFGKSEVEEIQSWNDLVEYNNDKIQDSDMDFLNINVSNEYKYIVNGRSMFINPQDGEIFAFKYGFNKEVLKARLIDRIYNRSLIQLKRNVKTEGKIKNEQAKISLQYFTNIYGDYVEDITCLSKEWCLGVYFAGKQEKIISRYSKKLKSGL